MRPVTVSEDASLAIAVAPARPAEFLPESLSLVAPGGYRIEGLSVEAAAALLRALA